MIFIYYIFLKQTAESICLIKLNHKNGTFKPKTHTHHTQHTTNEIQSILLAGNQRNYSPSNINKMLIFRKKKFKNDKLHKKRHLKWKPPGDGRMFTVGKKGHGKGEVLGRRIPLWDVYYPSLNTLLQFHFLFIYCFFFSTEGSPRSRNFWFLDCNADSESFDEWGRDFLILAEED